MKYIIELPYEIEDFYDVDQYTVESDMLPNDIYDNIVLRSVRIDHIYKTNIVPDEPKKRVSGNVIFINPKEKSNTEPTAVYTKKLEDLMTIQFDRGQIIIPVGLIHDEILIMTMDEWFEFCIKE